MDQLMHFYISPPALTESTSPAQISAWVEEFKTFLTRPHNAAEGNKLVNTTLIYRMQESCAKWCLPITDYLSQYKCQTIQLTL